MLPSKRLSTNLPQGLHDFRSQPETLVIPALWDLEGLKPSKQLGSNSRVSLIV